MWDPEFKQAPPSHLQIVLELKAQQARKTGEFEKVTVTPNEKDNYTTINISPGIRRLPEKRSYSEGRPDSKKRKSEEVFEDLLLKLLRLLMIPTICMGLMQYFLLMFHETKLLKLKKAERL